MNRLFCEIHDQLHAIAVNCMRRERVDHTWQPTALVNEAYLKLLGSARLQWGDRLHFTRIVAKVMRQVLIDYANAHGSKRSGGDWEEQPLTALVEHLAVRRDVDYLAVIETLEQLEAIHPEVAEILEMHYFGGMTGEQIAYITNCSPSTIDNRLKTGKAWMREKLKPDDK